MINTITNLLVFIVKAFLHFIQLSDLLFISEIHDQPDDEEADELHTGYDQQGTDIAHPSEQQRDRDKQQDDQRTVQRLGPISSKAIIFSYEYFVEVQYITFT